MNKELRDLFDKENIVIKKITIINEVVIIESNDSKYVIKRRKKDLTSLYSYLLSRSFNYFPEIVYSTLNYDIYRFVDDVNLSFEERAIDIIKLLTLLHSKTTYYKSIDDDTYKRVYEGVIEKLDYLNNYYNDISLVIENEEYMSPSNYLFIRNISRVFQALNYCRNNIGKWYEIISDKKRVRIVNIHNNLSVDHYLFGDRPYFISWDKSRNDLPIYDLIVLYKKYYSKLDFFDLLKIYENSYPMFREEKLLFFSLISIPDKLEFDDDVFNMCIKIDKFYRYIDNTEKLIGDCNLSKSGNK